MTGGDAGSFVLDFGKHRGEPLCEVPTPYLQWLYRENVKASPELCRAIYAELKWRGVGPYGEPLPDSRRHSRGLQAAGRLALKLFRP